LLRNPVFSGFARWPDGGGGGPNVELAVTADFLDVLFVGARKKVAAAGFERAKLEVADDVLALAAEARQAFAELQAAQQMLDLRRKVLRAEEASAETARRLQQAGNISQLDADSELAMYEQERLELFDAEAQVSQAREHLAALMGLPRADDRWRVAERMPEPAASEDLPVEALELRAVDQRLDLAAARAEANVLSQQLGLSRATAVVSEAEVGASTERDPGGERVTGPELSVPLPLFDLGQARVAAARHRLREAQHRLDALSVQARSEVRLAHDRMLAARRRFEHYRDAILPLRRRIVEQSQLHYNGMLLGVPELLDAKRNEVEAGRGYLEALRDYWVARAELERAVGGRLPAPPPATRPTSSQVAATAPATVPATAPAADHAHHPQ
jgi:cobalt-zinc-cadmium efflux system outer membrane protein